MNELLKQEFIKQVSAGRFDDEFASMFRDFKPLEEKLNKDLCQMNHVEVMNVLSEKNFFSYNSYQNYFYKIRKYQKWCVENKIPGANVLEHSYGSNKTREFVFTISPESIYKTFVSCPEHLHVTLNTFLQSEDKETTDNIDRMVVWLTYMGLDREQIDALTKDDVDFLNMEVGWGWDVYKIYRQAYKSIYNCVNLQSFAYINSNYTVGIIRRNRLPGDRLIRGVRAENSTDGIFDRISKNYKRDNGVKITRITYDSIRLSGLFFRLYTRKTVFGDPDFSEATRWAHCIEEPSDVDEKLFETKRKKLEKQYLAWEQAYFL